MAHGATCDAPHGATCDHGHQGGATHQPGAQPTEPRFSCAACAIASDVHSARRAARPPAKRVQVTRPPASARERPGGKVAGRKGAGRRRLRVTVSGSGREQRETLVAARGTTAPHGRARRRGPAARIAARGDLPATGCAVPPCSPALKRRTSKVVARRLPAAQPGTCGHEAAGAAAVCPWLLSISPRSSRPVAHGVSNDLLVPPWSNTEASGG